MAELTPEAIWEVVLEMALRSLRESGDTGAHAHLADEAVQARLFSEYRPQLEEAIALIERRLRDRRSPGEPASVKPENGAQPFEAAESQQEETSALPSGNASGWGGSMVGRGTGPTRQVAQKPVELGQAARQLASLARKLQALSKALDRGQVVQARKLLAELGAASLPELGALLQSAGARLRRELEQLRADFGSSLERACRESGIPFQLLSREPLAFRLAPLELRVELERGTAELLYARERLERLDTLAAERVLAAYRRHLRRLEGRSWDPAAFHRELRRAWQRLAPEGGRVELSDLLPELVLLRQPPRFRRDPSAHNFRPYSRANFAYDLWRLRRDEALSVDGWRLVLGTATGGSTRDRSRVLFVEGPDGRGQFYLTLRFQREGGAA